MKKYKIIFLFLIILLPVITFAGPESLFNKNICSGADCDFTALAKLINNAINWFLGISVLIAACTFSWAGFMILINKEKPEELLKEKSVLWKTMIGMIIVLTAWLIVHTIIVTLVREDIDALRFLK
ncbi:MAG: hypothetical protein V1910_02525 [bacterium]